MTVDYEYALELFDAWVEPEHASRASEVDALHTFWRMLSDQSFREDLITFLAVGPCSSLIKQEIEERYEREAQSAA